MKLSDRKVEMTEFDKIRRRHMTILFDEELDEFNFDMGEKRV